MNEEILNLPLTRENAEYLISVVSCGLFGCYQGDKKSDDLVKHPENIEQKDFDEIALPQSEVKKAQTIITELQGMLYKNNTDRPNTEKKDDRCWICGRTNDEIKKILMEQARNQFPDESKHFKEDEMPWTYNIDVNVAIAQNMSLKVDTRICAICWCSLMNAASSEVEILLEEISQIRSS